MKRIEKIVDIMVPAITSISAQKIFSTGVTLGGAVVSVLAAKAMVVAGFGFQLVPLIGTIAGSALMLLGSVFFHYACRREQAVTMASETKSISLVTYDPESNKAISIPVSDANLTISGVPQDSLPKQADVEEEYDPQEIYQLINNYLEVGDIEKAEVVEKPVEVAPLEKKSLELTSSDKLLTSSNVIQWGLIGLSLYGVTPTIVVPLQVLATLGSEIATFCSLPKDSSWLRKAMSIPRLSSMLINYNPWIGRFFQAVSLFNLGQNAKTKLEAAWKEKDLKTGSVHLFNLASGVAFTADSLGLINLSKKTTPEEPSKAKTLEKRITFATVSRNGPDQVERNEVTQFSTENHKSYAAKWGATHEVSTEDWGKNQCTLDGKIVDCSPYFNRFAYLKDKCDNYIPKEGVEDWVIYQDDDLIYTNSKINPYRAIDKLREGKDTSMIVAQEGADWIETFPLPGYDKHDPRVAVNSGFIMTRMDKKGCDLINRTWAHRNDPTGPESANNPDCKTIGTCKNLQTILCDQTAMAMALQDDLSVIGRDITVTLPRDKASATRKNIAFNTLHRDGCLTFQRDGQNIGPLDIGDFDREHYPDGQWRPGDWNGHTAGFPMKGRYPLSRDASGRCFDDLTKPIENIRLKKLKEMEVVPKFTLGMVYEKSNSDEGYDHLTLANHAEYAKRNGADLRVNTDPIEMKCDNPKTGKTESCVPYWRKMFEIQKFVNEPSIPGKEEWYVYADEDGIYANLDLPLTQVLKDLQGGSDASIIVAKDGLEDVSYTNTGLLFIRKDKASRKFVKKWIEMRNAPSISPNNCPTLGTCDQRFSLHEQEALNRLLTSDNKNSKTVKVVDIRSNDRPYGVNSYFRDGCFERKTKSYLDRVSFTNDPQHSKAQKGDFYIQTAGVPRVGKYCHEPSGTLYRPLRKEAVQKIIDNYVLPSTKV